MMEAGDVAARRSLSICVIVPMLNEELNAERCARAIIRVLGVLPCRAALIVVDDGSTDDTPLILERLKNEYSALTIVTHTRNYGYGRALQTGIREAAVGGFEYALFVDSDLTNDPKHIPDFISKMEQGYDVIKASRYISGGAIVGVPLHRVVISFVGNRITRWLMRLPIADCTNGFRAVRVDILRKACLTEPGFAIIMEELYNLKYLAKTFCEIPYVLTTRGRNLTASRFRYKPGVFWQYLKYPLKARLGIRPSRS